jgi:hypothetical protein
MLYTNPELPLISSDLSQAIYYGALEMLGAFELRKFLKKAGDLDAKLSDHSCQRLSASDCKKLLNSLIEQYGLLTAQGICLRIGRVTFQYLRRNNPEIIFCNSFEECMLPLEKRINNELRSLTQWLQMHQTCKFRMEKENENWIITMNYPEECQSEMNNPSCYFFNGILQESLEWIDSHRRYRVEMHSDSVNDYRSYGFSISYHSID